ncbi:hypothetical protein BS17DRAFT_776397 [Gyrodon lividus]|nr:hypothetical protein BS17DRAFT_776397 [Gyrodon lividus]
MFARLGSLLLVSILMFMPAVVAGHCGAHGDGMFKCCQSMDSVSLDAAFHPLSAV